MFTNICKILRLCSLIISSSLIYSRLPPFFSGLNLFLMDLIWKDVLYIQKTVGLKREALTSHVETTFSTVLTFSITKSDLYIGTSWLQLFSHSESPCRRLALSKGRLGHTRKNWNSYMQCCKRQNLVTGMEFLDCVRHIFVGTWYLTSTNLRQVTAPLFSGVYIHETLKRGP